MRLTIKDENNAYWYYPKETDYDITCQKLGQLEDIEEELGIDLITLFKALKNGVYYYSNSQLTKDSVNLINQFLCSGIHNELKYDLITSFERKIFNFKDYGKTWALAKEELE